jgi:hypothetical protein
MILIAWSRPTIARSRVAVGLFAAGALVSVYAHFLGAMVFPSGFNNNLDLQPQRLWDVRNSELELSTRKLIRLALSNSRLAAAFEPARGVAPPAPVWWRPDRDDDSIPGWIDSPLDASDVSGPLTISGWARSASGNVDVSVSIAPDHLSAPVERTSRPDVCRSRPELGDCSHAGWQVILGRPSPGATEHVIVVELKSRDGRVRRLGPIRIRWRA